MKKKIFSLILVIAAAVWAAAACGYSKVKDEGIESDVPYTIVTETQMDKTLRAAIEKYKPQPFHLTYRDEKMLWIVIGYGEKENAGYSITVDHVKAVNGELHVKTSIIGPEKDAKVQAALSYPYIVLEIEDRDSEVVFDTPY